MTDNNDNELMHYGMPRRSGRYPWGSGKDPYQRTEDFLTRIETLKKQGLTEKEIADAFELTTTQLRAQKSLANAERRALLVVTAQGLRDKGYSLQQITKEMGYKNDSSVRSLLNEKSAQRMDQAHNIKETLKKHIDEKGMIDVGVGVERELGVSTEKLNQALYMLEQEGYQIYTGRIEQVTNKGQFTTMKVIGKPDSEYKDMYDPTKVHSIRDYNTATGECNVDALVYPKSLDINRVKVRYAEEGGEARDGTIELRRGVQDLDLGNSHYAQVRILVDNDRYLKGMAVYKDDSNFPDGVDVIFNTNKSKDKSPREVFKEIKKDDPNNPFGTTIKAKGQSYYIDKKTGKRELSVINKKSEEGDWNDWKDYLPSQFLSKQNMPLIKKQLSLTLADREADFDEIMSIPNGTVRKNLLMSFAEDCDGAAVHLKAAALPRQKYQVILPIDTLKDNEVYAPNFKNGETVALIRYPHGGTFEIPILKVNNKNKDAIDMIGTNPKDAICINKKNADRLSGADFDGDTVMVIPTGKGVNITSTAPLKGLVGFDNKKEYPATPNSVKMKKENVGREMGVISNLITDMTLKGATNEELTRAVKHSMVVIDAYKHKLDYKKSEQDNGIAALKKKYQTSIDENGNVHTGGASTLISRAKGEVRIDKRVGSPKINQKGKPWYDPNLEEGAMIYYSVKQTYVDKNGKTQVRTQTSTKMAEARDARTLSSGRPQEEVYADYANSLKSLANKARKAMLDTPDKKYSPDAKKKYAPQCSSLMAKLNQSLMNAPRERQAQLLATSVINAKKQENPNMEKEELKKIKQRALSDARNKLGAKRTTVEITDDEWDAIEAGAISPNKLSQILQNTDTAKIRERATPRDKRTLSEAKVNKLKCMMASGYSNSDIAEALGISPSTVTKYL